MTQIFLKERFIVWRVVYHKEKIDFHMICSAISFIDNVGGRLETVWKERTLGFEYLPWKKQGE